MKKIAIFEIDDVLADTKAAVFGAGFRILAEDPHIEGLPQKLLNDPNFYYGLRPIAEMVNLLNEVRARVPVGILAARPPQALSFTKRWLNKHVGGEFKFVACEADKASYIKDKNLDVLFMMEKKDFPPEAVEDIEVYCLNIGLGHPHIGPGGDVLVRPYEGHNAYPFIHKIEDLIEEATK